MSASEQRDLLSRFGVPNIEAGEVFGNGEHVVTNASGAPGGIVNTTFSRDGLSVQNVTTPVHVFVGVIDRSIGTLQLGTYINTHGYGNAGGSYVGQFRDHENLANGPGLFNALDSKAASYAAAHYKGC